MTEREWLTATEPCSILDFLQGKIGKRKLRLFAVACCRRNDYMMSVETLKKTVEISDLYADRLVSPLETLDMAKRVLEMPCRPPGMFTLVEGGYIHWDPEEDGGWCLSSTPEYLQNVHQNYAAEAAVWSTFCVWKEAWAELERPFLQAQRSVGRACIARPQGGIEEFDKRLSLDAQERAVQCRVLRDIFGNPFRPVTFNPAWRTSTVTAIAQTIYDNRQLPSGLFDNQRMGILADAIEEAGCDNREILDHCRSGGDHWRGCWVVDSVLGKE